ncbi:alpha-SNAP [Tribonema minus]|uniref:Alpha-SNAP n=1 Tax=Tribonema minus TaxID=303371 RepID=A0A836CLW2_9STRA|nr:alpha-SNAP [Tribonema minus]
MAAFGDQENKARALLEEGEKVLNKKSLFGSLLGSNTQKYEDAAEKFAKAANCFKVARKLKEAGDTYMRVASMHEKCASAHEAASAFMEAGKCYKESYPAESIGAMRSAITHYTEMGRFSQAAKLLKDVGEVYEADANYPDARDCFQMAADYFNGENSTQSANACLIKVATISSKFISPPDYMGAAKIFEDLGRSCTSTRLLQMNAKGYFQQAVLCLMAANDSVAARLKLDEFKSVDFTFGASRECKFAEDLCAAMETYDGDAFATASYEYDQVTALDPWKTTTLVTIKRLIEGGGGAGSAGDVDLT